MFDRDMKMPWKTCHNFVDGIVKTENHLSILAYKIDDFIYLSLLLFFSFLFFLFFDNPGNSTSFLCLIGPWNFHMLFPQQYPENSFMSSVPSSVWMFSGITHCQHVLTISNAFQNNSKMFRMTA